MGKREINKETINRRFVNSKNETIIAFIYCMPIGELHIYNGETYPKHTKWKDFPKCAINNMIESLKESKLCKRVVEHY